MKKKGAKNITYTQRLQLEACLKAGLHKKVIAEKVGLCLSAIYKEIKRGEYAHRERSVNAYGEVRYRYTIRYSPNIAEEKYRMNLTAKGAPLKIGNDYDFVRYVEKRVLQDKISPCAVLGEIKRGKMFRTDISKTTMYRYIETGIFMNISLQDLPMYKKKKRYRKVTAKRAPRGISIEKRPIEIASRDTFGHWEMDCVCGKGRAVWLVLSERLTRKEIIMPMPNQKAESVVRCLNSLERRYGANFKKVFKTITVDNGAEFSDFMGIEKTSYGKHAKRTQVYYCHPYTSCERGTNERLNREIRRLVPKGSDLSKFTVEEVQAVEDWVNAYPREIFGYATSAEMFNEELKKLA
ncbi:MAG: IS30 family transposase [Clostridia bacterium]|nr:IS30 family transposase [Clostridia bacterium]